MDSFDYPDTSGSSAKTALLRLLAYLNSLPLGADGAGHDEIEKIASDLGYYCGFGPDNVRRARHRYEPSNNN